MNRTILVSACLLGLKTRYNDEQRSYPDVIRYLEEKELTPIPVCPEQLAGLPTPRQSASFKSGDGDSLLDGHGELCTLDGTNVNDAFKRGAEQTLLIAQICGCHEALLKQRSPSCGSRNVYRNEELVDGNGVTSALLKRHAINVFSEEDL